MAATFSKRIVSDKNVLGGKLVIKGTRISVEFILELLGSGMSFSEILEEYSHLTKTDLQAVITLAERAVERENIIALPVLGQIRLA